MLTARFTARTAAIALPLVLLAGCTDDDGAGVREIDGSGSASSSGSASGSASGSTSGSGSETGSDAGTEADVEVTESEG